MEMFDNPVDPGRMRKARRFAERLARNRGGHREPCEIREGRPKADPPLLGIVPLEEVRDGDSHSANSGQQVFVPSAPGLVVATIRMGFGHYRMALAIASAAFARGRVPYWLDFLQFRESASAGLISYLEGLYSWGSRLSQKLPAFNSLVWEKITAEIARPLSGTARDQAFAEVFAQIPAGLSKDVPYVATHPWTARAAVQAGMQKVVSIIPDNLPLAFNLAPGAVHAVQTPSAFLGYRTLKGMGDRVFRGRDGFRGPELLRPMPEGSIFYSGHYVDHELVSNLEADCERRLDRFRRGAARRLLFAVGGAGAQLSKMLRILAHEKGALAEGRICIIVNMGDHYSRLPELLAGLRDLGIAHNLLDDDWPGCLDYVAKLESGDPRGLWIILHKNVFPAVYSTNLLLRQVDLLVTKPSELSFYPVPKLFIQRVGRHEAWGAIHSSEIGDGSMETSRMGEVLQLIDIFVHGKDLLPLFVDRILANKQAGVYDGAYRVVDQVLSM